MNQPVDHLAVQLEQSRGVLVIGRVNARLASLALTCVFALAGGMQITVTLAQDTATLRENSSAGAPNAPRKTGASAPEPEKVWTPAAYINSRWPRWVRLSG